MTTAALPPATSAEARERLVGALGVDLVGPFAEDEVLPLPPSRWYLTGFLACAGDRAAPREGPEDDDAALDDPALEDAELGAAETEADDEADPDPEPRRRGFFPSSLGVSLLLPPEAATAAASDRLRVTVSWADYRRESVPVEAAGDPGPQGDAPTGAGPPERYQWRRQPDRVETVPVRLDAGGRVIVEVPDSGGLRLEAFVQASDAPGLAPGTRAVALFLVNGRPAVARPGFREEAYAFQVGLKVVREAGLVPRPDLRDAASEEWDARVSDLQLREVYEWAVGHGVSVESELRDGGAGPRVVRTTWLPRASVQPIEHRSETATETRMEALGALAEDGAALEAALAPLADEYGKWIAAQRAVDVTQGAGPETVARREETRDDLLDAAERARGRIAAGVALVARDPVVREAFARANRALAAASRKRSPERYASGGEPRWRLFQLAFLLLNVASVADDTHPERAEVELIFFPTGGGKTEAYLGVIAFTLVLRRLRGRDRPDEGLGVAVILRYTLRLLTLDQLSRAATLVCALELQRRELEKASGATGNPLGSARFAIGLWVGRSATANTIGQVERDMAGPGGKRKVFPLVDCPWCQEALAERSVLLDARAGEPRVVVSCAKWSCEFSSRSSGGAGLPVLFVDEQIYRELPCFLVATVDKYAMTPWRGEVGMLFGRATARQGERFYGPLDGPPPAKARPLPGHLVPPELIVQDELHLISGPLGTMTGLFETAIEQLTRYEGEDGKTRLPKILASTATVREARHHVKSLFGRGAVSVFPPRGVDANETFFSQVAHDAPGRDYVGVAASGRRMKQVLLRTYIALLAGAGRWYAKRRGPGQAVDPYMTLVGYFNSLRELGGMRRLVEDEVRSRCRSYSERVPNGHVGDNPYMGDRKIELPAELTSRESTDRIKETKAYLALDRTADKSIDVLLASNMISVGVDIDRLGLMVMAGQPKTTAEYIQSTSRVGRDAQRPGLVVTCLNLYKARDRSHYEHFRTYHASFYRRVEAGSLTPFSGPALDRGLAAVLVGLVRHWRPALTEPERVMEIAQVRDTIGRAVVDAIVERARATMRGEQDDVEDAAARLEARLLKLLDTWETLIAATVEGASERKYSGFERKYKGRSLLVTALDVQRAEEPGQVPYSAEERRFLAPTSMRDVEPEVHVYVDRRPPDAGRDPAPGEVPDAQA